MSTRQNISSGTVWEEIVSYSRAVRIGNIIEVAGTTAVDGGTLRGTSAYQQTQFILEKIETTLQQLGADRRNIIRTRIYVIDVNRWEDVGRAHGEFFKGINPASSLIGVKALIRPDLLVEIEATAILEDDS